MYLCVAYPEIERPALDEIQAFRRDYDPNYALIEPHFTIVFPLVGFDEHELTNHIESRISEVSKINCVLDTIEPHESNLDGLRYLFLTPTRGAEQISSLHDTLYADKLASHLNIDEPYQPHLTIVSSESSGNPKRIMELTSIAQKQIILPIAVQINSITLCDFTDGHITNLNEFDLG